MPIPLAFTIKMTIIIMKVIGFYTPKFSLKKILLLATNTGSRSPRRICPANFTLDGQTAFLNYKYFFRIYPTFCVFTSLSPTITKIWVNSRAKSTKSIRCSHRRPPSPSYCALKNSVNSDLKKGNQKIKKFLKCTRKFLVARPGIYIAGRFLNLSPQSRESSSENKTKSSFLKQKVGCKRKWSFERRQ